MNAPRLSPCDKIHIVNEARAALPEGVELVDVVMATADRFVILARRDHPLHPFIVWSYFPSGAPGVHHGSYCVTLDEARAVFNTRR